MKIQIILKLIKGEVENLPLINKERALSNGSYCLIIIKIQIKTTENLWHL